MEIERSRSTPPPLQAAYDLNGKSLTNFPFLKPRTGLPVIGVTVLTRTTSAMTLNTLYATPFLVVQNCQITAARVIVNSTGGTGNGRLGIYKSLNLDRVDTPSGGALVADWGAVSAATTGVKSITSLTTNLTPGWHYLVIVTDNSTPTWYSVGSSLSGLFDDFGGAASMGWSVAFTYAALEDPFPAGALPSITAPIIGVTIGSYS